MFSGHFCNILSCSWSVPLPLNSVVYIFFKICSIPMSHTSVSVAKQCDATSFDILSWPDIWLHATVVSKVVSPIVSTMHHPSNVLNAYGPPYLLGMTSNGPKAFEQFPSMKGPIETHFPWVILLAILSRYFHLLIFSGVATSSSATGDTAQNMRICIGERDSA